MEKAKKKTKNQITEENSIDKISRNYSKDKSKCQITFYVPKDLASEAQSIAIAGSFNDWDHFSHLMNKLENGDFSLVVELDSGNEYEFRYILDESQWINTPDADKFVWSDFGNCENMVIIT